MTWLFSCWTECQFSEINVLMVCKIPLSMTAINGANAHLTLARGSRCFVVGSTGLFLPSLCAVCGRDVWRCDVNLNATPNVRLLSHSRAIWMLLCKLCKKVFSRHWLKVKGNSMWVIFCRRGGRLYPEDGVSGQALQPTDRRYSTVYGWFWLTPSDKHAAVPSWLTEKHPFSNLDRDPV